MFRKICTSIELIIAASILLVGCSTSSELSTTTIDKYGNSAVSRMPVKRYLQAHKNQINHLSDSGVQVIQTGDELTFVLPSDECFIKQSPIVNTNYSPVLIEIANLIKDHEKFSVRIAGYTDSLGWGQRNLALSRAQALSVANFLWEQGVDARLIYSTGNGMQQTVANNSTAQGRAMNRRIEITLQWVTDARQG